MPTKALPTIEEIQEKAVPILRQHGAVRAAVFGSCARGEMKKSSDVDLLVDFSPPISLLRFVGVKLELEKALARKVDLVEYEAIKPRLRDRILADQVQIL